MALVWLAVVHPTFRDAEGFLTGDFAVALGAIVGLVAIAVFGRRSQRTAVLWIGLVAAGQGAFLTLIRAGDMVGYQHLVLAPSSPSPAQTGAQVVLVLQALLLCVHGREPLRRAIGLFRHEFGSAVLVVVVAGFVLTASTLSPSVGTYLAEVAAAAAVQGLQLWTVIVAAHALPKASVRRFGAWMESLLRGGEGGMAGRLPWMVAGITVGLSTLLAVVAYGRHPHLPDEVVYLLHARYFAAGMLEMPLPPSLDAFAVDLMTVDPDRWFSPVPPGWPAVLALGVLVGAPWLVNPVLGGVAVLLTHRVVLEISGDERSARLATILLATSPWFLFLNMSFMTHTLTLVSALAATLATALGLRAGKRWMVPAGIAIGVVALIRPLEGLIMAGALGMWSLFARARSWGDAVLRTTVLATLTLVSTVAVFPYNRHFTGHAMVFPIMDYTDRAYGPGTNAMGFGSNRGLGWSGLDPFPGHGWIDVLVNTNVNLFQVNVELLGWSIGAMLPLLLGAVVALRGRAGHLRAMVGFVVAVICVHSLYWFSGGPDFGARYWYLVVVPCVVLCARSLLALSDAGRVGARAWAAGTMLVMSALLVFMPWRAIDKYHNYRRMRPDVREMARVHDFGDALVLVRGDRHPDYASAATYNPLDLRGPGPIYAWDYSDAVREEVLAAYPDKAVWVIEGPTRTGFGYEVIAGPIRDRSNIPALQIR